MSNTHLSDEELLEKAEHLLQRLDSRDTLEGLQAQCLISIANSLLVIARSSVPMHMDKPIENDFNRRLRHD